jgi:hypothetical protein
MKGFADDDPMTEIQQVTISSRTKKLRDFNSSILVFIKCVHHFFLYEHIDYRVRWKQKRNN